MNLRTRDFLTFAEIDGGETRRLLDLAERLKRGLRLGESAGRRRPLAGATMAMIFQKPSTRTRVSFETGMFQLGGHAINLSASEMQLSRGETIEDTARTLSRYVDVVMARVFDHSDLDALARHSEVPVVNGLSDSFHPCQTLADLLTIRERKGRLRGLKVCWVGDGNNVCNSLIYGCARTGMDISVATPRRFRPLPSVVDEARGSVSVDLTADPAKAAAGADVVMTDTFSSIHNKDAGRSRSFVPRYTVGDRLMARAAEDAVFMHCLPAKRGLEVTASIIDGPQSAVWDEAENRLHAQKALLAALVGPRRARSRRDRPPPG